MIDFSKYKINLWIIVCILLFFTISIFSISSAQKLVQGLSSNLVIKQVFWYSLGLFFAVIVLSIKNNFLIKNAWFFYIIGIILLVFLLLFADPINSAKCWFVIPGIGTFQPSEFMKIALILVLAKEIDDYNDDDEKDIKEEFYFLIKIACIVLVPAFLTFLQPDTGVVLIYLIITATMLFIAGIRLRWFIVAFSVLLFFVFIVLVIFFTDKEMFINIFGTDFFLRIDRLLDWSNKSGFQLENGIISIGSGGFTGTGIGNTPLYFPESQTDFIFAVFANNFGFIGSLFLISLIVYFDIKLILMAISNKKNINKYLLAGIVGMLIYQQIQNIGMTFGLLPITGITLPFISYGGSSLISYMIMLGIIFSISNESLTYKN